jgi:hypothetical protein
MISNRENSFFCITALRYGKVCYVAVFKSVDIKTDTDPMVEVELLKTGTSISRSGFLAEVEASHASGLLTENMSVKTSGSVERTVFL